MRQTNEIENELISIPILVIKDTMRHLEAITVAVAEVATVALMEATEIIVEIKQTTRWVRANGEVIDDASLMIEAPKKLQKTFKIK